MSDHSMSQNIRIGLEIFERHGGTDCAVGHDEFYAGQKDGEPLTQEEVDTLLAAGWRISSEFCRGGCVEDGEIGRLQAALKIPVLVHRDPERTDREPRRHLATCNQWAIFT